MFVCVSLFLILSSDSDPEETFEIMKKKSEEFNKLRSKLKPNFVIPPFEIWKLKRTVCFSFPSIFVSIDSSSDLKYWTKM